MNPQPQVIIFQMQQKLEASPFVIEFYEHNSFKNIPSLWKHKNIPLII